MPGRINVGVRRSLTSQTQIASNAVIILLVKNGFQAAFVELHFTHAALYNDVVWTRQLTNSVSIHCLEAMGAVLGLRLTEAPAISCFVINIHLFVVGRRC